MNPDVAGCALASGKIPANHTVVAVCVHRMTITMMTRMMMMKITI